MLNESKEHCSTQNDYQHDDDCFFEPNHILWLRSIKLIDAVNPIDSSEQQFGDDESDIRELRVEWSDYEEIEQEKEANDGKQYHHGECLAVERNCDYAAEDEFSD